MPDSLPTAQETEAAALRAGVGVYTVGSGGAVNMGDAGEFQRHLVLGYSSLTESQIETGIEKLAQALAS
jgi:GntR family transcriptional regulator / MocR family aminotransferase